MGERAMLGFCVLLTPLLMWGAGLLMKKAAPAGWNGVYGYRTRRSSKSPEAWAFAQQKAAAVMTCWGKWLLLLSLAACGIFWEQLEAAVTPISVVQVAVLVCSILPVELALRRNFDEEGHPVDREGEL